jgi:dolichol-phosphate mannosyltransferase
MSQLTVESPSVRLVSIVIPVYNEQESLAILHAEIEAAAKQHGFDRQIIFVDDGSTDGSWEVIRALSERDPRVEGIRFRRNFGKAAALSAGFKKVRGPICMTLDADLQDDPAEIPRFLAELDKGYEVISGWKKVRYDPWHKVLPSRMFNALVSWMTGVRLHDHNCGMKCYRSEVLKEVRLYGELHRFIPVLAEARGFKIGELVINHRRRKFGRSKYGVRRFVKAFLDVLTVKFLTGFSRRPQHVLGTFGLLSFGLGALGLTYLAVTWIIRYFNPDAPFEPLHNRPLMTYSLGGVLLGVQLLSMGILAEMLTAYQSRDEDSYSISDHTPRE